MRKIALLTAMALTAMALTATTASAATQVRNAATGQLCPAVSPAINTSNHYNAYTQPQNYVSGGCTVRMTPGGAYTTVSSAQYVGYCRINYDIHVGPDGWGYANNFTYIDNGGCSASSATPSRVIGPVEANPSILPGAPPAFDQADANTDLNMHLLANKSVPAAPARQVAGWVSLDATQYFGLLRLTNQRAPSDPSPSWNTGRFAGGVWTQTPFAGGPDSITITH